MMQSQEKLSSLLAEALAMIEVVTTTRYDPAKVADLNRRANAALQAVAGNVLMCETMQRPKSQCTGLMPLTLQEQNQQLRQLLQSAMPAVATATLQPGGEQYRSTLIAMRDALTERCEPATRPSWLDGGEEALKMAQEDAALSLQAEPALSLDALLSAVLPEEHPMNPKVENAQAQRQGERNAQQ